MVSIQSKTLDCNVINQTIEKCWNIEKHCRQASSVCQVACRSDTCSLFYVEGTGLKAWGRQAWPRVQSLWGR